MSESINPLYHNLYKFVETESGLWITNSEGVIQYCNDLFLKQSGFAKEEVLKKSFRDFFTDYHSSAVYEEIGNHVQKGLLWKGYVFSKGKHKNYWTKMYVLPIKGENSEKSQVVFLRFETSYFENKEKFRMTELGELTRSLGHEINNVLAIILGKVSGLKRKIEPLGADPKVTEDLEKIATVTDRIGKMVKAIKSYGLSETEAPMETVALSQLIENVLQLEKKRLMDHKFEVRQQMDFVGSLVCRVSDIEQVLVYLINHSYMSHDGAEASWIELSSRKLNDEFLKISLKDSGVRPRPDGLGFSFALKLVENHGGRLFQEKVSESFCYTMVLPFQPRGLTRRLSLEEAEKLIATS